MSHPSKGSPVSSLSRVGLPLAGDRPATGRVVPGLFLLGWALLAWGETFGTVGAPAVPLALSVAAGLLLGPGVGFWSGFTVGLAADLLSGLPLGAQAFAGGLIGGGIGNLSRSVSPSAWGVPVLATALLSSPYRWLVVGLARLGGISLAAVPAEPLWIRLAWDVGVALVLFLILRGTVAGRRT